jgi:glycosyltransferase involved in cell wall biosynthesis
MGIDPRRPVLLYMGGFSEIKGIFPMLEAIRLLRETHPDILCVMPGTQDLPDPPEHIRKAGEIVRFLGLKTTVARALDFVRKHDLGKHLYRMPFVNGIGPLMGACDLLVFPATRPHFARPVVEAAAMGTPSIASSIRGMDETLLHGKTGLIIPDLTPHKLAYAISGLIEDDQRRREMGTHAIKFARENFSAASQIRKIEAVLASVYPGQLSTKL